MTRIRVYAVAVLFVAGAVSAYELGRHDRETGVQRTFAPSLYAADANTYVGLEAGTVLPQQSPVGIMEDREVYYPGTEALASDEMRVTACGTGMPNARPKQAAACWLVELGNGDKFIFDIGTGSAERISALKIPHNYLDKVFIGHLHSDHFGDMDALWVGMGFSPFIMGGRRVYQEVIEKIYADINETYGTSFPAPTGRPGGN